ncbi:MAG: SWIM zinc finger family protein [Anaerolineales bacterium]|uniref:SWIM zinc finger family protein n=1 Tax=Candidatus Desulfolinea nitratireducens TaxID=2841698 RepID=A0A8J6NMS0_9CHLR|nr:SWIM zinc finger family protein [Candidatus Desulfolinea nitratireducens]MBL6960689.1 SWIM zinc finger family protein [Anaerolineales bacterium]
MSYYYFKPTKPKEVEDGIKARSKRGAFASSWWAKQWISALERLVDSGRLGRGRSYARKGQVISIDEKKDGVLAKVQGSRRTPYKVTINITSLTDAQWEEVIDALSEQAIFTAQLLAGEMPQGIEEAFDEAGASLFPKKRGDLYTECSCPDYANPCKHIAAAHYILGERFDEDPFLIFRLRGRTQDDVMQALRERRAGEDDFAEEDDVEEEIIPLDERIATFFELGASLDGFSVSIQNPAIKTPLLKRLGEASFVPKPGIEVLLQSAYSKISEKAIELAYEEDK